MPNWVEVLKEIDACATPPSKLDLVRRKYFKRYYQHTGRNAIAYYSGWLQVGNLAGVDVNDMDINGFMATIHGMDCSKGLDIILHTPGGAIAAAEHLVYYLKSKFGDNVRAVIPQIAMSAGTMIACSCKSIVMGKQSALAPIDPQVGGVPARGVVEEFKKAIKETRNDKSAIPIWQMIISKYHPTFVDSCEKAWNRSIDMIGDWLSSNMLQDKNSAIVTDIVEKLAAIGHKTGHDTHISKSLATEIGLKIESLEEDNKLQDLILTTHHAYIHTLSTARLTKIIENHNGIGMFNFPA